MEKQAVYKNASLELAHGIQIARDGWFARLFRPITRRQQTELPAMEWLALAEQGDILFMHACEYPSNLELDWQWLYTEVMRIDQKLFCLQKVLHINPGSEFALKELRNFHRI